MRHEWVKNCLFGGIKTGQAIFTKLRMNGTPGESMSKLAGGGKKEGETVVV